MTTIPVALGARSYDIIIEAGLLGRAVDWLAPLSRGRRMAIVTDENVLPHLATVQAALTVAEVNSIKKGRRSIKGREIMSQTPRLCRRR